MNLTVTFIGEEQGTAGLELLVGLSGAHDEQDTDLDCPAVEPSALYLEPSMEPGATVSGQFCGDYPDEALGPGAALFAEELEPSEEVRGWWALPS